MEKIPIFIINFGIPIPLFICLALLYNLMAILHQPFFTNLTQIN